MCASVVGLRACVCANNSSLPLQTCRPLRPALSKRRERKETQGTTPSQQAGKSPAHTPREGEKDRGKGHHIRPLAEARENDARKAPGCPTPPPHLMDPNPD